MSDESRRTSTWLRAVLAKHERRLVAYAARIVGDVDLARDVAQETFLKLIREGGMELDGKLPQWLYTVCRRRAIDVKRKERRMQTSGEIEAVMAPRATDDPAAAFERQEQVSRAEALVAVLPDKQQEAVRLRFTHGLSYKQIADVMDTTVNNVGVLIHTGVKTLRARLAPGEGSRGSDEATKGCSDPPEADRLRDEGVQRSA